MRTDIENSIFSGLLSQSEKLKYRVIEDRLVKGGKELMNSEWQEEYVSQIFEESGRYPFLFVTINVEDNKCIGRFISFNYDVYRIMWITINYKRCLDVFYDFIGTIIN